MRKYLSLFAVLFAIHGYANKPDCPNTEAVKKVGVTNAEEKFLFGFISLWIAASTDNFGTPHTWNLEIAIPGDIREAQIAVTKGQNVIQHITGFAEDLSEDEGADEGVWVCNYLSKYKDGSEEKTDLVVLSTKRLP